MADLEYTITTKTELAGAQAAATALEKQIGKAKALKKDYSDLEAQLNSLKGAMGGARVPVDELADAEAKLNEQKHSLIQNIKVLRHEHIPGLSEAFHILRHPIVAIGVAIGAVVEAFKKWDESIVQAVEQSQKVTELVKPFEDLAGSANQSASRAAAFAEELARVGENASDSAEALKRMNEQAEMMAKLQDEQSSAAEKLAIANINLRHAQDPAGYSKVQADRDIAATRLHFEDLGNIEKLNRLHDANNRQQSLVTGLYIEQKNAGQKATDASAARKALEMQASHQAELGAQGKPAADTDLNEMKGRRDKLTASLTSPLAAIGRGFKELGGSFLYNGYVREAAEQAMEEELKTIEESIKAAEQRATEKAKFDQIRQEQIKKSVEEEKRLQERLKEISRLYISATKKLEADKAAEEAKAASTGTVFGTHEQTSDAETRAKEAEERRKAIEEYNHSNKEIRTRREHGQDDSDILRKRGETERTLRDTGGIPVTMGKVADEAEQLNRNVSRLLEQLQGVNAQIQTLS